MQYITSPLSPADQATAVENLQQALRFLLDKNSLKLSYERALVLKALEAKRLK